MKRIISCVILAMVLITSLVSASFAKANDAESASNTSAMLSGITEGVPITIYYNEKGGIREVKYGAPAEGFSIEVTKEEPGIKTLGLHERHFDLWDTYNTWRDETHTAHYLDSGQRQLANGSWAPDASVPCFVGIYNVDGAWAYGFITAAPNGSIITIGTAGDYRPQAVYYGSRQYSQRVHWVFSYYPNY